MSDHTRPMGAPDWRPPIGTRILLTGDHPATGRVGEVIEHEMFGIRRAMRVRIPEMAGHVVGVLKPQEFKVIAAARSGAKRG